MYTPACAALRAPSSKPYARFFFSPCARLFLQSDPYDLEETPGGGALGSDKDSLPSSQPSPSPSCLSPPPSSPAPRHVQCAQWSKVSCRAFPASAAPGPKSYHSMTALPCGRRFALFAGQVSFSVFVPAPTNVSIASAPELISSSNIFRVKT